jgi:hypothetical protein
MLGLKRSWWLSGPGLLLGFALLSGGIAWRVIAWPVASLSNQSSHVGHFALTFLHMAGGTCMLLFGAINLYIGATRKHFRFHRLVGYLYLGGGSVGAILALLLALATVHGQHVAPFAFDLNQVSNLGFSLASLATAWLLCAGLGFRAARNRRIDNHRQWMVRSYVLAWSFVLCRLAGRVPVLAATTGIGGGESFVWLSWLVPLALVEIGLQWQAGAALTRPAAAAPSPR